MKEQTRLKLKKINPSCILADHLFGKEHSLKHKMISGGILMIAGVCIANLELPFFGLHYLTDMLGYALHGMGGIPFGEYLSMSAAGVVSGVVGNQIEQDVIEEI